MDNNYCKVCDVFYNDLKVYNAGRCGNPDFEACQFCYCNVHHEIFDLALGLRTSGYVCRTNKTFDASDWWTFDVVSERRQEVFKAQNFQKGDRVVIVREESFSTKDWTGFWDSILMNKTIGKVFNIEAIIDKSIYIINGMLLSFPWWVVRHEAEIGVLKTNISLSSCPRCKGSLVQKTSFGFSGQSMIVNKCEACGYCN